MVRSKTLYIPTLSCDHALRFLHLATRKDDADQLEKLRAQILFGAFDKIILLEEVSLLQRGSPPVQTPSGDTTNPRIDIQ